jgi:predicted PurR-regulated permease PerM
MATTVSVATRWGINAIILLAVTLALYFGKLIFIPTILALLLAAMLWPLASHINQYGLPLPFFRLRRRLIWIVPCVYRLHLSWGVACTTAVGVLVATALGIAAGFGFAASKLVIDLGSLKKQVEVYGEFRFKLKQVSPWPLDEGYFPEDPIVENTLEIKPGVFKTIHEALSGQALIKDVSVAGLTFLWQSILIMFILLFLLLEGKMLTRRVVEIFGPTAAVQSKAVEALKDMAGQVRSYLVWRTIINFGMAFGLGVVYHLSGLRMAWAWCLLTAVLWYIPYLGPIAAGLPPVIDSFVSCPSPWASVFLLVFYIVVVVIEGYLVFPLVLGRSMEMNATTVMLACLFWEVVWGPVGLFLAMPLMGAIKAVCAHVPDWEAWANLMSDQEKPERERPSHPPDGLALLREERLLQEEETLSRLE